MTIIFFKQKKILKNFQISGLWYKHMSNENELDENQENMKIEIFAPENGVSRVLATSYSKM